MRRIYCRVVALCAKLRNLLLALLVAGLLAPTPAQAIATCTAPAGNAPVTTTCAWIFLLYACRNDNFGGGNLSTYAASWVNTQTGYKTWNNQEIWDNACNSNTVPASGDNVILGTNSIVTMDATRTVNNFQLNGGCDGYGACKDTYLTLNGYNLNVQGNFTNNSYAEWNCGRYYNGSFGYQSCESNSSSMCEDVCDGHGWTIFNGSAQQTIGGTSATSFTYLEIDNPAGVKLAADVIVTGRLKITNGFIDTNGYSLKVYADCATYPILGSGYVLTTGTGALFLNFQGGGTETCVFPVADSNGRNNVTVTKYGTYKGSLKVLSSATAPDTQTNMAMDLTNNANHYWTLESGVNESYWSYAALNGATWSTAKPGPAAVSTNVTGLSTSVTYDVTFQFCATAGTCTLTEKDGAGNGNVTSFIMVQNKTKVAGSGKWTTYATPTNNGAASTTTKTGLTGAFGWFNVGVADPGNAYAGIYGGIKLNWKQTGDSGCGTACAKTAAASVLWLGKGVGALQSQPTHWYGVTTDPGDTWTVTGLGSNLYTIASAVNGKCLKKDTVGSYLLMAACNAADATQQWRIMAFSPSGETNGVSFVNPTTGNYAHLVPSAGTQEVYVDTLGNNWKGVFFLTPPPPPDHFRFEFDKNGFLTCQPLDIAIKACKYATATEPACTTFYPASITLTPGATKGTWSGLTGGTTDTFTGSDTVALTDTTAEATTLSYSGATVTPTNATLECYDTSTSAVVGCTQSFAACSSFFDAVEKTTPVSVKGTNLFTKLAGVAFNFDVVGPPSYTGDVTVDLVDASAAAWNCASGAPTELSSATWPVDFTAPSATSNTPITTTLPTIDPTTLTRRNTFTAQYGNAAKKVRVRILDALGNCYHSTDYFSIRPTSLSLASDAVDTTTHVAVSGTASATPLSGSLGITITATALNNSSAVATAYTGTPGLNTSNTITDWTGAGLSWQLPTSSPPTHPEYAQTLSWSTGSGFPAASAGITGGTFYYNDFGPLTLPANTVIDNTFTSASTDQANVDCISGSTSNALSGGKYGCDIGSASLMTPRFRVDHYAVTNTMSGTCNGSTYMGQGVAAVNVTARNADGGQMTRLLSGAASYYATNYATVTFPTITLTNNGAAWSPSSSTINFTTPAWPAATPGGYYDANTNSPDCTATSCPYARSATSKSTPVSLKLRVEVTDSDAGTLNIKTINGTTQSPAVRYAYVNEPNSTTISFRHGMLKLDNVYGSELLKAYIPVTALYWNGTGWQRNTDDSCTPIYRANIGVNGTIPAPLGGSINILSPASGSFITLDNGQSSITLAPTGVGNVGSADIAINLGNGTAQDASCVSAARKQPAYAGAGMTWLQGTWCNAAAYSQDPSARVNFGTAKSQFLYRREKY